jgi:hypothetical protein
MLKDVIYVGLTLLGTTIYIGLQIYIESSIDVGPQSIMRQLLAADEKNH